MGFRNSIVLIFAVVGSSIAFPAEYIPKSYYVIHPDGVRSPTVFLRDKRSLQELIPLVRMRRSDSGNAGSGGYSGSFSSAGSSAGSGAGSGNDAVFFADNLAAVMKLAGFPNGIPGFPGGIPGAHGASGYGGAAPGYPTGGAGGYGNGLSAPDLHSRFGGDDGVSYSGSAEGAKGVYSASSSSIDGDGNVKYSVKTGKF